MGYGTLAALVVIAHFAFLLFVIFGGLLAVRWRRAPWLHLPALAWGAFVEATGRVCPLTPLENHFRRLGGETDYLGSFIEHYLVRVMYPPGLTREAQVALALALTLWNVAIYAWLWRRRSGSALSRRGPPPSGRP
jgi:hypothetical protein